MKLTDFLTDAGRPVAYFPKLKRITGSTTATILLCQFIYWRGKEADQDGWLYKTSEEIEEETGLTYNEQKTARKALVEAGLVQEHYARLDHQLRFKIDLDKINESWGIEQPKNGECDDSTLGNDESPFSLNSNTETTTENRASPLKTDELPIEIINSPVQPSNTSSSETPKKGDPIDGMLFYGKQAQGRGEDKVELLIQEMERGLHVNIPRTTRTQSAAKRILKDGRPFGRWLTWCISDQWRASHLYLYADLDKIWQEWPQAFEKKTDELPPVYNAIPERVGVPRPAHIPPPNIKRSKDDSANS